MRRLLSSLLFLLGCFSSARNLEAQPVENVKICSLYGLGFYYIPGTDVCLNPLTGDTRGQSEGGTWRSILPYPEGDFVSDPAAACGGSLFKVGSFKSSDFTLEVHRRKITAPFSLPLNTNQQITKVIMSGGFYDPRVPARNGVNGAGKVPTDGLCLRAADPDVTLLSGGDQPIVPGIANLTIGCISNSRIVNMPQAYSIAATQAYPQILVSQRDVTGNLVDIKAFGDQLIVTTDYGWLDTTALTYCDPSAGSCTPGVFDSGTLTSTPNGPGLKPLAGTLNVWACVETGN